MKLSKFAFSIPHTPVVAAYRFVVIAIAGNRVKFDVEEASGSLPPAPFG